MKYQNPRIVTLTNECINTKTNASAKVCILKYLCWTYNSTCQEGYSHCDLNYDGQDQQ